MKPPRGQILPFGRGLSAGAPVDSPMQLIKMCEERGGDGFHFVGNVMVITRTDIYGNSIEVDRYEVTEVKG